MVPVYVLRCDEAHFLYDAESAEEAEGLARDFNAGAKEKRLAYIAVADVHQLCTKVGDLLDYLHAMREPAAAEST